MENEELTLLARKIKDQGYNGICFWQPVRCVGGGVIFFAKHAQYLAKNTDLSIYYVDYHDGYAHDILAQENSRVKFIDFDPNQSVLPIEESVIVITNSTRVVQIKQLPPKSKLLFWHYETIPCAWDVVLINREAKKFLRLAYENRALVYHDWSSRNIFKVQYGLDFQNKDYLTILYEPHGQFTSAGPVRPGMISIGWLGRLSTDKICSLYNLMDNLAKLQAGRHRGRTAPESRRAVR